jgi:hypothetical protein
MTAFLVLREKVLRLLLANAGCLRTGRPPRTVSQTDLQCHNIQKEMQRLFETIGIAA